MTEIEIVDSLLELINDQPPDNEPNTFTTPQFALHSKLSRGMAIARLDELVNEGKIERAIVYQVNKWGQGKKVQGYRLL